MSDLYNRDIVTRSELVNEAELDRENIAEEIESAGHGDLHAVTSWLMQAPRHDLKTEA